MDIKTILVTSVAEMDMHRANSGQNQLGNVSAIKRRPDGRVYISGQMQRHAFFSALEDLNRDDPDAPEGTYVSSGDGTTYKIAKDLRADLGGFLLTDVEGEGGRRTAPLSATPAVALEGSDTVRDLLLRLNNQSGDNNIATMETSQTDRMRQAFSLDCTALSTSVRHEYEAPENGDQGMHVGTEHVRHVPEEERERRARLFLEATRFGTDYASQARNAATAEPDEVLIVLDPRISRKAARYFSMSDARQESLLDELEARGARYFHGDDAAAEGPSVHDAYREAAETIEAEGLAGYADEGPIPYAETYEAVNELVS
jgi:CRISPR-associated protein Cst2